jgi:hypothetical protein
MELVSLLRRNGRSILQRSLARRGLSQIGSAIGRLPRRKRLDFVSQTEKRSCEQPTGARYTTGELIATKTGLYFAAAETVLGLPRLAIYISINRVRSGKSLPFTDVRLQGTKSGSLFLVWETSSTNHQESEDFSRCHTLGSNTVRRTSSTRATSCPSPKPGKSERTKRIEEYSRGSFVGPSGFGKCGLKFCLGHL